MLAPRPCGTEAGALKVILVRDVKGLGAANAVVEVSPGHARNLLLPKGLAVEATSTNLARLNAARAKEARDALRLKDAARAAADRLMDARVLVRAKAGDSGRLFGSVTAQDVADAIAASFGIQVDRRRIVLEEPFKTLGDHVVELRLHPDVAVMVHVLVEAV